ncbi:hypothetical protein GX586_14145 [bacterium]|nr:hypothetical protein [bacterium]
MNSSKTIAAVEDRTSITRLTADAQKKLVGGIGIAPSGPSTRDTSINGDTQGFVIYE